MTVFCWWRDRRSRSSTLPQRRHDLPRLGDADVETAP